MKLVRRFLRFMPRLGPAERIGLGLTSIVIGVFLVMDLVFDVFPDNLDVARKERSLLSQSFAVQAANIADSGGADALSTAMPEWVRDNDQLLSIAVRGADGLVVAQSDAHDQHWKEPENGKSTLQHILVPLMQGDKRWGTVELSFVPAGPATLWQWVTQPWVLVILALGFGGFVLFSLYLRRAFEYLDPQSVLPGRIRSAFDAFSEGVMVIDPAGRVILANTAIRKWLGKDGANIHGRAVRKLTALNAALAARPADHPWMRAMKQGASVKGEYIDLEVQEGDFRKLSINCSPVLDDDSAVRGCIATFDDITEVQRINAQLLEALEELKVSREEIEKRNKALQQMAMHDVLTGCLNRRAFFETAVPAFQRAHDQRQPITCIMMDIDHFKSFNDNYGHQVGDEVLKVTARILTGGVRNEDVLCRYGGEEFCIVMPSTGGEEAARVAEQLRITIESRAAKNVRGLKDVNITASFGVCEFAQHKTCEDLIRDADEALYMAKEQGRNRVNLHKPTLQAVTA